MFCYREQGEPVDSPMFADPVPDLHMLGMGVLSEAGGFRLLGGEEALLDLGDLEEPPLCIAVMSRHNTILQLKIGFMQTHSRQACASQTALPATLCFPVDWHPTPAQIVARTVLPNNLRQGYDLNAAKLWLQTMAEFAYYLVDRVKSQRGNQSLQN